jgi:hypothetical protein
MLRHQRAAADCRRTGEDVAAIRCGVGAQVRERIGRADRRPVAGKAAEDDRIDDGMGGRNDLATENDRA